MLFNHVKDSGTRESFTTGSVRDSRQGKGRFDLIPGFFLKRLAMHYENGAVKYGDANWQKGQKISRYFDSCLRHLNFWQQGLEDEDHLIAAVWNLAAIVCTLYWISISKLPSDLDDRESVFIYSEKKSSERTEDDSNAAQFLIK